MLAAEGHERFILRFQLISQQNFTSVFTCRKRQEEDEAPPPVGQKLSEAPWNEGKAESPGGTFRQVCIRREAQKEKKKHSLHQKRTFLLRALNAALKVTVLPFLTF